MKSNFSKLFLVLGLVVLMGAGCEDVITKGEFLGLNIGASKVEVIAQLAQKSNIQYVRAEIRNPNIVRSSNIHELEVVFSGRGFIVEGGGIFTSLIIDTEKVIDVRHHYGENSLFEVKVGDTSKNLEKKIHSFLKLNKNASVYNFIIDSRALSPPEMSKEDFAWLSKYNLWLFSETDAYSQIKLYFKDNKLEKIVHLYTLIELP